MGIFLYNYELRIKNYEYKKGVIASESEAI